VLVLSPKFLAILLAAVAILLLAEPLAAQSTGRSIMSRPGSLYRQGLPPATMFDSTGRSPGSLSPRTTTPNAPLILKPANPTEPAIDLNGRLPESPRQRVED
jgi:hypothetical protein